MVREGETALRRGGRGRVLEGAFCGEDGNIGRGGTRGIHRRSKVFTARGGDEDIVGVDCDVFVEWSEEKSVEDFLGYSRGSRRHDDWR